MGSSQISWFSSSLNRKFTVGTAAGLVAFSVLFLALFIGMYQSQLRQQQASAADQVNRLLQTSLEAAMLRRDLDMLRSIVGQFGEQKGVKNIIIVNRKGEIRFSDQADSLNRQVDLNCDGCTFDPAHTSSTFSFFTQNSKGEPVMRTVHPVANRPPCKECHGLAAEHPVNGTLIVDYDASAISHHAVKTTLVLMGSGAVVVLINLAGGWWFIRRFVIAPIRKLDRTSLALASGDLSARVVLEGNDELAQLGDRFNNMAENLQASLLANRKKRAFLQGLVDANPDGIRVIDQNHQVVLANKAYCDQLGLTPNQALGLTCYQATHGRQTPCTPTLINCPLQMITATGKPIKVLHQHIAVSGDKMAAEVYAAPVVLDPDGAGVGELMVIESIRDLGQTVQISHEQKMSELGRLAAGIAHEIHNPLTSVRLALDSLVRYGRHNDSEVSSRFEKYVELVDQEINRCIEVTERLLKMSMFTAAEKQVVDLNRAIDETLSLLKWEAAEDGVETVQELDASNPRIVANESDVRIAVLNLAQNAFHAMPDGGRLRVTSSRANGHVKMCFEDNGVGIPLEDISRIFDPFFSRRADYTQGTGLGLSIARTLMERYQGHITVRSQLGCGSQFTVSFPDPDSALE
ncbi:MAG: HAMP domain-containing protein [Gammaproteobacteria bacterium]|nr:HAMP domain-containing protein [Gammaproteobacteria bacterium]